MLYALSPSGSQWVYAPEISVLLPTGGIPAGCLKHTLMRTASHPEANIKEKAGRIFLVTPGVVLLHHYECRRVSTKQQLMKKKQR